MLRAKSVSEIPRTRAENAPVPASVRRAYTVTDTRGGSRAEGYQTGNALISYVHAHFGSNPAVASAFVDACAKHRAR